jgi:short-subunit dehydrogenase
MDETQASGMSADDVATEVLNAVALQRNEVLVAPLIHRVVTYLRNFMPDTICREMAKRATRQFNAARKQS